MNNRVYEVEILWDFIVENGLYDRLEKSICDVGCGTPEHFSNSAFFIKNLGWKALLVDGLEKNIELCRSHYNKLPFVDYQQALVSDRIEPVRFVESEYHWSLSGVDYKNSPNTTTQKLSDILKDKNFLDIGVLSLDIENMETKVLFDLIHNNIFPQIMIVEANELKIMQEHRDLLEDRYKMQFSVLPNQVFVRKDLIK